VNNNKSGYLGKITIIIVILSSNMFLFSNNIKNESCFSETNFEFVYQYLNDKIATQKLKFYAFADYEIHLINENEIKIKNNGGTMAIIRKEKGILALAKLKSDNEKQLTKANNIFCELVAEVKKNKNLK